MKQKWMVGEDSITVRADAGIISEIHTIITSERDIVSLSVFDSMDDSSEKWQELMKLRWKGKDAWIN